MDIETKIRLNNIKASIEHDGSDQPADAVKFVIDLLHAEQAEKVRLQSIIDEASAQKSPWLQVIDEALFLHHVGVVDEAYTYDQAKQKLNLLLCAQQSPAVAVPDYKEELFQLRQQAENWSTKLGFIASVIDSRKISLSAKEREFPHLLIERLHTDSELLKQRSGSPRITEQDTGEYIKGEGYMLGLWSDRNIESFKEDGNRVGGVTEQDAREIGKSIIEFMFESQPYSIDYWMHEEGRTLLGKLNGAGHGTN